MSFDRYGKMRGSVPGKRYRYGTEERDDTDEDDVNVAAGRRQVPASSRTNYARPDAVDDDAQMTMDDIRPLQSRISGRL